MRGDNFNRVRVLGVALIVKGGLLVLDTVDKAYKAVKTLELTLGKTPRVVV